MKKSLKGKKILLIVDVNITADRISKDLIKSGAEVTTYTNGLEGLAGIRAINPDLVFIDTLTPLMNGRELLEVMKSEGILNKIPTIVIASSSETEVIQSLIDLGASDFLLKDKYEPGEIVEKAETYLNVKPKKQTGTDLELNDKNKQVNKTKTNQSANVLIVEDDPLLRNLLSVKLTRSHIKFNFSHDGINAVPLVRKYNPDVLILDLMLPGKDGFTVLKDLKEDKELSKIPVIILSNRSNKEDLNKAKELGAIKFFVKALTDLNEIVEAINEVA